MNRSRLFWTFLIIADVVALLLILPSVFALTYHGAQYLCVINSTAGEHCLIDGQTYVLPSGQDYILDLRPLPQTLQPQLIVDIANAMLPVGAVFVVIIIGFGFARIFRLQR